MGGKGEGRKADAKKRGGGRKALRAQQGRGALFENLSPPTFFPV